MIKKYLGLTVISASLAFVGCSSNDDDGDIDVGTPAGPEAPEAPDVDPDPDAGAPEAPATGGVIEVPTEFTPNDGVTLSLAETLAQNGNFNILLQAVADAGLTDTLANTELTTIFAPTDDVLAGVELPTDQTELNELVTGHVVIGALDGALVANSVGSSAQALNGTSIAITADEASGTLFASGVPITGTDIQATNGIIHTIGGVIGLTVAEPAPGGDGDPAPAPGGDVDPGEVDLGPSLNNLSALGFSDYVSVHTAGTLGLAFDENPWTVFIPTNDAIPDTALGLGQPESFAILNDHIITTGVIAFGDLSALGASNTNSGLGVTFGGTPDAPTINGFDIIEIDSPGTAALYQIDGLLQ